MSIDRREFLKRLGVISAGAALAACGKEPQKTPNATPTTNPVEKYTAYYINSPNTTGELRFPLGETRPETGSFSMIILPGALNKETYVGNEITVEGQDFLFEVYVEADEYSTVRLSIGIGQNTDINPKDTWTAVVDSPLTDLDLVHLLDIDWENWDIKSVAWDKVETRELLPFPSSQQSSS